MDEYQYVQSTRLASDPADSMMAHTLESDYRNSYCGTTQIARASSLYFNDWTFERSPTQPAAQALSYEGASIHLSLAGARSHTGPADTFTQASFSGAHLSPAPPPPPPILADFSFLGFSSVASAQHPNLCISNPLGILSDADSMPEYGRPGVERERDSGGAELFLRYRKTDEKPVPPPLLPDGHLDLR